MLTAPKDTPLWFALLMPGFVTIGTARLTSNLPGVSDAQLVILYFLASAFNAAIVLGVTHIVLTCRKRALSLSSTVRSVPFLAGLLVTSITTGIVLAVAYEAAWLNRGVRSIVGRRILPNASPHDPLEVLLRNVHSRDHFDDRRTVTIPRQPVALRLHLDKQSAQIIGVRAQWHSTGQEPQVYLSPACSDLDGKIEPIAGPGAWIPLKAVLRIDFLDLSSVPCVRDLLPKLGERVPGGW